jgi:hypothetical protein
VDIASVLVFGGGGGGERANVFGGGGGGERANVVARLNVTDDRARDADDNNSGGGGGGGSGGSGSCAGVERWQWWWQFWCWCNDWKATADVRSLCTLLNSACITGTRVLHVSPHTVNGMADGSTADNGARHNKNKNNDDGDGGCGGGV